MGQIEVGALGWGMGGKGGWSGSGSVCAKVHVCVCACVRRALNGWDEERRWRISLHIQQPSPRSQLELVLWDQSMSSPPKHVPSSAGPSSRETKAFPPLSKNWMRVSADTSAAPVSLVT